MVWVIMVISKFDLFCFDWVKLLRWKFFRREKFNKKFKFMKNNDNDYKGY